MKGVLSSFRPIDGILLALVLTISVISGFYIYGNRGSRLHLVIEAPSGSWIYDLNTDRTVDIPGPLGNTVVRIEGGTARITDSPCPNKTCIAAPPVAHKGDWNACLPNKVILRVDGEQADEEPDAIVD